jgi:hypothetical protein
LAGAVEGIPFIQYFITAPIMIVEEQTTNYEAQDQILRMASMLHIRIFVFFLLSKTPTF